MKSLSGGIKVFNLLMITLFKFSEGIFENVHFILDISDQAGNGCPVIDHIDTLSV